MATETAEQFVARWLEHWGVDWPHARAAQLVNDLRKMTGDELVIKEDD